jgi:hypothetical protein
MMPQYNGVLKYNECKQTSLNVPSYNLVDITRRVLFPVIVVCLHVRVDGAGRSSTKLYGLISKETALLTVSAVRTSDLTGWS